MSKRTKYLGNEELIYLMPLDKNSSKLIPKIKFCSHRGMSTYNARFIHDTNFDLSFKERMKKACDSGCKQCFIFGEKEVKNDGITVKNLINGNQKFIKCENIKKTLFHQINAQGTNP